RDAGRFQTVHLYGGHRRGHRRSAEQVRRRVQTHRGAQTAHGSLRTEVQERARQGQGRQGKEKGGQEGRDSAEEGGRKSRRRQGEEGPCKSQGNDEIGKVLKIASRLSQRGARLLYGKH